MNAKENQRRVRNFTLTRWRGSHIYLTRSQRDYEMDELKFALKETTAGKRANERRRTRRFKTRRLNCRQECGHPCQAGLGTQHDRRYEIVAIYLSLLPCYTTPSASHLIAHRCLSLHVASKIMTTVTPLTHPSSSFHPLLQSPNIHIRSKNPDRQTLPGLLKHCTKSWSTLRLAKECWFVLRQRWRD